MTVSTCMVSLRAALSNKDPISEEFGRQVNKAVAEAFSEINAPRDADGNIPDSIINSTAFRHAFDEKMDNIAREDEVKTNLDRENAVRDLARKDDAIRDITTMFHNGKTADKDKSPLQKTLEKTPRVAAFLKKIDIRLGSDMSLKDAILTLTEGNFRWVEGGRQSIDQLASGMAEHDKGVFLGHLIQHAPHMVKGTMWTAAFGRKMDSYEFNMDVMRERYRKDPDGSAPSAPIAGKEDAFHVANAFRQMEQSIIDATQAYGGYIRKVDGRTGAMHHNRAKMQAPDPERLKGHPELKVHYDAAKTEWAKIQDNVPKGDQAKAFQQWFLRRVVDEQKSYGHDAADADILDSVWDGLMGNKVDSSEGTGNINVRDGFKKQLFYKTAEDEMAWRMMNGEFNLHRDIEPVTDHHGRANAQRQILGGNAKANLRSVIDALINDVKDGAGQWADLSDADRTAYVKELNEARQGGSEVMQSVDFSTGQFVNQEPEGAKRFLANFRSLQVMSKLGRVTLLSLPTDTFNLAQALTNAGINGEPTIMTMAKNLGEATSMIAKQHFDGDLRSDGARKLFAEMGDWQTSWNVAATPYADGNMGKGMPAKGADMTLRLSGVHAITNAARTATSMRMQTALADAVRDGWDSVNPTQQSMYLKYGIGPTEFSILKDKSITTDLPGFGRSGKIEGFELDKLLSNDRITDAEIAQHYGGKGSDLARDINSLVEKGTEKADATTRLYQTERYKLRNKIMNLTHDMATNATPKSDARSNRTVTQGYKPDTWPGQIIASAMQFKVMPLQMHRRMIEPALSNPHASGGAKAGALIPWMVAATAGAAAADFFYDLAEGYDPMDRYKTPELAQQQALRSLMRSGTLGLYGDMVYGSKFSSSRDSLYEGLTGPSGQALDDIYTAGRKVTEGNFKGARKDAAKIASKEVPFANTPGISTGFYLLFGRAFQDAVSPGYSAKREENVEKYTGKKPQFNNDLWGQ